MSRTIDLEWGLRYGTMVSKSVEHETLLDVDNDENVNLQ